MEKRVVEKTSPSDAPVWFNVRDNVIASPEDQAKRDARDVADQFKDDMVRHMSKALERV
jgi:hypothetical protein